MDSGVYKIEHKASGRCYVGSAVCFKKRWKIHRDQLEAGNHHNKSLLNAWRKYGSSAFVFGMLERCPKNILLQKEQHWLDKLEPFGRRGYNICRTADAVMVGRNHKASTKLKMSQARKGQKPSQKNIEASRATWTGRKHTRATKEKMCESAHKRWSDPTQREMARQKSLGNESRRGKVASNATRRKMSEAKRGCVASEETKRKMSIAQFARWQRKKVQARAAELTS